MKFTPYPHQVNAVKAILESLSDPHWSLVEMPTGSGKSFVINEIVEQASHLQILVITPRKKLREQLQKVLPEGSGLMSASYGRDDGHEHDLVLGTNQTLIKRTMKHPELILIDECHLLGLNSEFWKFLNSFSNAKVVGLTATPFRGEKHIQSLGWHPIFRVSILDLVKDKLLCPPRSIATGTVAASFEGDNLEKTDLLLDPLLLNAKKRDVKKLLVFCQNIAHAEHVADQLVKLGESAVFLVHSKLSDGEITKQYNGFTHAVGRSWLINVTLVSLGVDIPCIDAIVILRDVSSFSLFVQMLGRGLRTLIGKTECLIFDFGNATRRFGFIDQPDFEHTSSISMRNSTGHAAPFKICECGTLNSARAMACSHCKRMLPVGSKLNETSWDRSLLSTPIYVETLDHVHVAKLSEFAWEMTYKFRGGAISAKDYFQHEPKVPRVGGLFLLEMIETDAAVIRSALQ
jgi:superfamily II DNA or RNA helicase